MVDDESEKIPSWDDRYDTIKTLKCFDPQCSWTQLVLGIRKKDGKSVLRLRKFRNWFTISSEKHLNIVQKLLEEGANELGWNSELSDEKIEKMIGEYESLQQVKRKSEKQINRQKETIDKLLGQLSQLREEQLKLNIKIFKSDIKDFKRILKDNSNEKTIQNWLFDHPWVFGPTYIEGSKEEINRKGDRIDFLLKRYDTFYDIIELKLPNCKLFVGKQKNVSEQEISRQYNFSSDLKDAISQVIGYLETYEIDKTNILWETGISIHKPKGIIVIGRRDETNKRALRTLNSYLHNIEILTFEDIVDIGNNFIKLIENRNMKLM